MLMANLGMLGLLSFILYILISLIFPRFWPALCAAAHSYYAAAIRRLICRWFGTEPEPTGSGPNQIQY